MLIRRYSDPAKTVRKGRHEWPKYCINRQEVILDPWEEDDCAEAIRFAIGDAITVSDVTTEGWFRMAGGQLSIGQDFVRVLEDPETGYIYYRRPIDIERQQKWNQDKKFRVKAEEWWDTAELNQWWKRMVEGKPPLKRFHLRDVLAVITGLSQGAKYFSGLQAIYDFLSEKSREEKKEHLLAQFPQLADCEKDLSAEDLVILREGKRQTEIDQILATWIDKQITKHGEYFNVAP